MKVGIIGLGFVGSALLNGLKDNVEVMKIDPKIGTSTNDLLNFNPDIIFISVPTPMSNDGTQDLTILDEVINELISFKLDSLVVLKSTILPSLIRSIEKKIKRFVYNPEFLREKTAAEDFKNSSFIIFGGSDENSKVLSDFYTNYTFCKTSDHIYVNTVEASLIKYAINSFLATKVIFFNQLFDIFEKLGSSGNWNKIINAIGKDIRVGTSHMEVPGHDGRKGFGGACFPKDTNALNELSKSIGANFSLLENVIMINNQIRISYNSETEREKEQNIKFKAN
jgi:UDPglucose 6-dehydrogenase